MGNENEHLNDQWDIEEFREKKKYIYIYRTSHGNPLIFTIILCLPISVKIKLISIYACMCIYRCICTYVFIANVHTPHTYKKARNV
jgi:hypothetical protein